MLVGWVNYKTKSKFLGFWLKKILLCWSAHLIISHLNPAVCVRLCTSTCMSCSFNVCLKWNCICRIPKMKNQYLWRHVFHCYDTDSIWSFSSTFLTEFLPGNCFTIALWRHHPLSKIFIKTLMCLDNKTSTSATCRNVSGIALLVAVMLVKAACLSVIHRNMSLSQIQYHGTLLECYS